jgi:hypothetical protein
MRPNPRPLNLNIVSLGVDGDRDRLARGVYRWIPPICKIVAASNQ